MEWHTYCTEQKAKLEDEIRRISEHQRLLIERAKQLAQHLTFLHGQLSVYEQAQARYEQETLATGKEVMDGEISG